MTNQDRLYKMIKDVLTKRGFRFECIEDYSKAFIVKTKFGDWRVRPDKEKYCKVWTIFTCFDNEKTIPKSLIDNFKVNTYSGKMNVHCMTMADTMWEFDYMTKLLEIEQSK